MSDDHGSESVQPNEGITRRKLVGTGIAAVGATVVWGSPLPFSRKGIGQSIDSANAQATGATGHADEEPFEHPIARVGYCAVAGNTFPDGTAVKPGTFLNLPLGQPETDPNYKGATIAKWVDGIGPTCDPAPPGFVLDGLYFGPEGPPGLYPFYRKA